ncbi:MAG: CsgE family curli-type amyloid fiber assembly protein [Bacteroidota bacterium]
MKLNRAIFAWGALLFFSTWCHAQIYNTDVGAEIDLEFNGEFFIVTAFAHNKTDSDKSVRYELSLFRNDSIGNNISKDQKEGLFVIKPDRKEVIDKGNVVVGKEARTILLLLLYDTNNKIIGKDRIVLNEIDLDALENKRIISQNNTISEDKNFSGADGLVLKGIVVENTKTKPGRDFYRGYAQKYDFDKIRGEKVVTVTEVLAVGSNTKIQLEVEGEIIYQFFVNPRADYIDLVIGEAIVFTKRYFDGLRKNRNLVKKY